MSELPLKKRCRRCGDSFYLMPTRLRRTPAASQLCRACRLTTLDHADHAEHTRRDAAHDGGDNGTPRSHPSQPSQPSHDVAHAPARQERPAPNAATSRAPRLYPCRVCGVLSVNRFYCPEHHQQISQEASPWAEDFGFGSAEGLLRPGRRDSAMAQPASGEHQDSHDSDSAVHREPHDASL